MTTDAIVIGGGVIGLSSACHLAERGVRVSVFEKDTIGAGASGQSNAVLRSNYNHPALAAMAVRSRALFDDFAQAYGIDPGFQRTGYLMLVDGPNVQAARQSVQIQRAAGARTEFLVPDDVARVVPDMTLDDVAGAIHEADAGTVEPSYVLDGLLRTARDRGVTVLAGARVVRVDAGVGRQPSIVLADGTSQAASLVLNAAGAWAAGLSPPDLPLPRIDVHRHEVAILRVPDQARATGVVLVDLANEVSYRPDSGRTVRVGFGGRSEEGTLICDPDERERGIEQDRLDSHARRITQRFPALAEASITHAYAAFIDLSPDSQFLLGPVAGADGYHVAAGMSGHAFKHCLLLGRALSDVMLDGRTSSMPMELFSPDRFEHGRPIVPALAYTRGMGHLGSAQEQGGPSD